jgi:hypothetical protein
LRHRRTIGLLLLTVVLTVWTCAPSVVAFWRSVLIGSLDHVDDADSGLSLLLLVDWTHPVINSFYILISVLVSSCGPNLHIYPELAPVIPDSHPCYLACALSVHVLTYLTPTWVTLSGGRRCLRQPMPWRTSPVPSHQWPLPLIVSLSGHCFVCVLTHPSNPDSLLPPTSVSPALGLSRALSASLTGPVRFSMLYCYVAQHFMEVFFHCSEWRVRAPILPFPVPTPFTRASSPSPPPHLLPSPSSFFPVPPPLQVPLLHTARTNTNDDSIPFPNPLH